MCHCHRHRYAELVYAYLSARTNAYLAYLPSSWYMYLIGYYPLRSIFNDNSHLPTQFIHVYGERIVHSTNIAIEK